MSSDSDFDIFVSYYEDAASDFAAAIYRNLQKKGYKVYVNHLEKIKRSGKFRPDIDKIIRKCMVFILLNTYEAIDRDEIIREVKVAFPGGVIQQEFWILRETGKGDVPLVTEKFKRETSINLKDLRQDDFINEFDLVRTILRKCNARRESKNYESSIVTVSPKFRFVMPSSIKIKYEDLITVLSDQIANLRKILDGKFAEKDLQEAERVAKKILDLDPTNAAALNALGVIFAMQKEFGEADKYFAMATMANKKLSSPWSNRGVSAYYQDKLNEALFFVNKALDIDQRDVDFINLKGSILFRLGKVDDAQKIYESSLKIDKRNSQTLSSKASVEYKLGNKPEALSLLKRATKSNEANANAWYNLGVISYDDGKFDNSIAYFNKSLTYSEDPYSYGYLGMILRKQAKYDEALQIHNKAIQLDPQNPEHYYNKGVALAFMENHEEALTYFATTLNLNPMHINARINKAVALYRLKRNDEAFLEIQHAIRLDGNNLIALNSLSIMLEDKGLFDQAENIYERIIEIDFKNLDNRRIFIDSLIRHERFDRALSLVQESIELFPDLEILKMYQIHILIRLGQLELALAECDKILRRNPDHAGVNYNKACIMSILGKTDQAISLLDKAIKKEERFKEEAKTDNDFKLISKDPRFIRMISESLKE